MWARVREVSSAPPTTTPPIALVVAMAENRVIGSAGRIPWRLPEDMRHFKALTFGKPCIMGRKTWESLPKKPLPGRTQIVVTRDAHFTAAGAVVAHTLEDAIAIAARESPAEIMVIGGAEIYAAALPHAESIYLTEVHRDFDGDARLAEFDREIWQETEREAYTTQDGLSYSFVTLSRREPV
jgi:dihydrofolate reductase